MSNLLEKASIVTTPTAYDNGKILSVKPTEVLGDELVVNGTFDSDTAWSKGAGWSISNGTASHTGGTTSYLSQSILEPNKQYKVKIKVSQASGNNFVQIYMGNSPASVLIQNVGEYEYIFTSQSSIGLGFALRGALDIEIDNVSVKEVIDGDFDFTRNSSATRVNSQGLIEDVQILSSNLVSNGDFSQEGSELITNGDFSNGTTSWSFTSGATLTALGAKITHTPTAGSVSQPSVLTIGKSYKLTYEITESVSGGLKFNSAVNASMVTTVGVHTKYLEADATAASFSRTNSSNNDVTITNISIKEVGQGWTLGSFTNIGDNVANIVNSTGELSLQQNIGVSQKTIKLTYTISNYSSGGIRPQYGAVNGLNRSANGTYTEIITGVSASTNLAFFSVTTNTTATITNVSVIEISSDTNLPRIDYTGGVGHWLFEPQSTNLAPYSEDFSNSYWAKSDVTADGGFTSPSGDESAYKLKEGSATINHQMYGTISGTAGNIYTLSGIFKKGERDIIQLVYGGASFDEGNTYCNFDLSNGVLGSGLYLSASITLISNGWYRCEFTATKTTTGNFNITYAPKLTSTASRNASYTGDGTSGVYVWGAQVEASSFATSIIPTSGSTVTRLQDAAFGSGSSDLINSTEGVLYFEGERLSLLGSKRTICISDGSLNNYLYIQLQGVSNTIRIFYKTIETGQVLLLNHNLSNELEFRKYAFRWSNNNFSLWINGIKEIEQLNGNTATSSVLNEINFSLGGGADKFFGKTKCLAVFKEALTDAELTCLTTI